MANVLLVDDEPENACSLALALEHSGHRVHITGDARAALDFMRRESIECLITDYQMPDIDGVQLCLMIRACPRLAGTPVLMVSAAPEPAECQWCCSQFFRKPVCIEEVIEAVDAHVAARITVGLRAGIHKVSLRAAMRCGAPAASRWAPVRSACWP
ncbi:response regulator [Paraburkholderia sp. CNPSo 3274]|uniref:response regulator n=1 Tax=Paraburkholderia sp. CNPSo 3274 TaxID=2940932 RepID=UPI0020B79C98|nr:response regulator [Paraburkholderia sp. CNPSo 3274]MCP3711553.1 response regulator [Paraburkholderia sp. CNPSo 3274]